MNEVLAKEVNILKEITIEMHNPYIVKLYDVIKMEDHIYIILEFCNGGSLEDF